MRPRPEVHLELARPPEEVLQQFRQTLANPESLCEGHVGSAEFSLTLRGPERHAWSPWISLEVRANEGGTAIKGRFGPHPNLWTGFVLLYSSEVFIFLMGAMLGSVQLMMGDAPTGLLVLGAASFGLAISCGIDLYGRKLGRSQMERIRGFVEAVLLDAREVREVRITAR